MNEDNHGMSTDCQSDWLSAEPQGAGPAKMVACPGRTKRSEKKEKVDLCRM